jgi:hypothetical protein
MPVTVEKIQEVAEDSLATNQRKFESLSGSEEPPMDAIMDIGSEQTAFYKLTVLAVKDAETAPEVAEIWKEAVAFYRAMIVLWKLFKHRQDPESSGLVEYYRRSAMRCLELSERAYKFHAE